MDGFVGFARHQFEISELQDDGSPLIAHLQLVWKRSGVMPEMLSNAPSLPVGCSQLWQDFLEVHGSRGSSGFGASRITFADLYAWQKIRRVRLESWEVDCIRKVDDMWLSEFAPKGKRDMSQPG